MTKTVTNELILEHLKVIQSRIGNMEERLGRIESRMSAAEEHLAVLVKRDLERNAESDNIVARVERIERRLELTD